MEPGFTRLVKADNLGRELGLKNLWVKDDSGNPTHSFKDRVVAIALSAARELGIKVFACPSTGNLANAVAAAGAAGRDEDGRVHPARPRAGQGRHDRDLRRHPGRGRRQLRRREPALLRDRRRGGRLGVRERQRPPLLRRGLQDARLRGRRAARLAAPAAGRHPDRVRLAADQDRQGLPGARLARPGRGHAVQDLRRPGQRLLAGRRPPSRTATTSYARSSPTPSPSRWPSATRPTAPTCSTSPGAPAARSRTSPTRRSSTASSCSPAPRASSPRPPAASPSRR